MTKDTESITPRSGPLERVGEGLRAFGSHFPVWFMYLMAWGLLRYEIVHVAPEAYEALGIAREWFALTIVFPLFWILLFFFVRIRTTDRVPHKYKALAFGALTAFFIGSPLFTYWYRLDRPKLLTNEEITRIYEQSQFFWVGILVLHALFSQGLANVRRIGVHRVVTFFGVTFLLGLMLENVGIIAGLFHEPHYTWYIGLSDRYYLPAPVCTQLGWCICFYIAIWMAEFLCSQSERLRNGIVVPALIATAVAISIDLQVDPMASLSGVWWRWDPRLEPWYLGVPLMNYAAWFGAFFPFSLAYFAFQRREDLSPGRRNFELFLRLHYILIVTGLISFGIMFTVEGGTGGPTGEILRDFLDKILPY